MAQKLAPFEAAQLGVFIHGLAGDIARDQNGEIGMIAGDLVDALPDAFVHAMPDPDDGHSRLFVTQIMKKESVDQWLYARRPRSS